MAPQNPTDALPEHEVDGFRFLSLPPEVRSMIYRHALVEGNVPVTGAAQPGILQVN